MSDADKLRELINDPEVLEQLCGYPFPCPLSRIKKDVRDAIRGWKRNEFFAFTVFVDEEIAGSIVLENPNPNKGRYDIGFYFGKRFWNQGIATEAIRQVVKFGFNKLKLYRVQGDTRSNNPASNRVFEKAGFKFEGCRKRNNKIGTKFTDLNMWGITK